MRLSRRSIWTAAAGVALGTGVAMTGIASAAIRYELRFSDGTHTKLAVPGTTYQAQLFAHVLGTTTLAQQGHQTSYVSVVSNQIGGGALASGGITVGEVVEPFNFQTPVGARDGGPNNITPDGIQDWGGTASDVATGDGSGTFYMLALSDSMESAAFAAFMGWGEASTLSSSGWAFHLADFEIHVATINLSGETTFSYAKPLATNNGPSLITYSTFRINGTNTNLTDANFSTVHPNAPIGITFIPIPEPGALSMLGLGAVGLLARRRRA